jgi:hypothetical protein
LPSEFYVGEPVLVHSGIMINTGVGVVAARMPHGYLAIRHSGFDAHVFTTHSRNVSHLPVDNAPKVCHNPCRCENT